MSKSQGAAAGLMIAAILGAALGAAPLGAQDVPTGKFDLRLGAGLALMPGGDLNAGLKGYSQYWAGVAAASGYTIQGAFAPAHLGGDFGADLVYRLSPRLGIGLGFLYAGAARESVMTFQSAFGNTTQTVRPSFGAEAIRLGVFETLPLSPALSLVLNAGIGYYISQATASWNLSVEGGDAQLLYSNVNSGGLGFHGGAALEYKANPFLSLVLELSGRYARLSGYTGNGRDVSNGESQPTAGTLYYFEPLDPATGQALYSMVFVFDAAPGGDVRQRVARVDLSGAALRLGVVFHF